MPQTPKVDEYCVSQRGWLVRLVKLIHGENGSSLGAGRW